MEAGRLRGLILVLVAGAFWGLSGTAAQVLFQRHGIQPQWLVSVRMLGAGAILYAWLRPPFPRALWRWLLLFSLVGVTAIQYSYFAAIAYTNVATATFLQYRLSATRSRDAGCPRPGSAPPPWWRLWAEPSYWR